MVRCWDLLILTCLNLLKIKNAIVNVKNNDEYCIIWAVLSALYPVAKDARRVTKYIMHFNKIFNFRLQIKDIPKFEKLNNLAINAFGYSYENNIDSYCPL